MILLIWPSFQLCECTIVSPKNNLKYFPIALLYAKKLMLSNTRVSHHLWFDLIFYGDVGFWLEINLHFVGDHFFCVLY